MSRRTNPSSPRRPVGKFERLRALTDRRHHEGCLPDQFRRERRRPGALLRLTPPSFGLEDAFCSLRRARGVRAWVWSLLTSLPRAVPMVGAVQPGSNGPSLCNTRRLPPNSTSSRILRRGPPRRYSQNEVAREGPTVPTAPSAPLYQIRTQELVLGLARRSPEHLLRPTSHRVKRLPIQCRLEVLGSRACPSTALKGMVFFSSRTTTSTRLLLAHRHPRRPACLRRRTPTTIPTT